MYITADKDKNLVVTFNEEDAEVFSLKVLGDDTSHHKFEFSLASPLKRYREKKEEEQKGNETTQAPEDGNGRAKPAQSAETTQLLLEYYLETVVNPLRGKESTRPRMKMNSNSKNIRMLLKKRVNHRIACDTKQWRKGREAYFIQCIHPLRSGYFCVKKKCRGDSKTTNPDDYKVCIKSSVNSHCDDSEIFMLFRLKSATECIREKVSIKQDTT